MNKKSNKSKAIFALMTVVAVSGILFSSSMASAVAPKFQTLRSAEAVWIGATHVCNENYMSTEEAPCGSGQACLSKAKYGEVPYANNQMYCTNQAYADCGNATNLCYCNWHDC
jgi:hypothetical protein